MGGYKMVLSFTGCFTVCACMVPGNPLRQVELQDLLIIAALKTCCDLKQLIVPFQEESKWEILCICIPVGKRRFTPQRVTG